MGAQSRFGRGRCLCCRRPFQHILSAYKQPIQRAENGIDHDLGLMAKKYKTCSGMAQRMAEIIERWTSPGFRS